MIVKPVIAAWLMSMMMSLVPRGYTAEGFKHFQAQESTDDTKARYESIVEDLTEVVFDPAEKPVYGEAKGRQRTAVLMLSIAFWESSYRKDVDTGIGKYAKGDYGTSFCIMQVRVGSGKTAEGWSGQDLIDDRKKCFRAALHLIHNSWGGADSYDALTSYASGTHYDQHSEDAAVINDDQKLLRKIKVIRHKSRQRVDTAIRWYNRHPASLTDMEALEAPNTGAPISQL